MAPNTAFNFILAGIALLLLSLKSQSAYRWAQFLGLITWLVGLLAFIGYAYNIQSFLGLDSYTQMAVNTAFAFILLSMGLLFARPSHGLMSTVTGSHAGSIMARRLTLALVIVPVALGLLIDIGYDVGLYSERVGSSLLVVASVLVLLTLVWFSTRLLNRTDVERGQAEKTLQIERDFAVQVMNTMGQGLTVTDINGRFEYVNQAYAQMLGYSTEELIGKSPDEFTCLEDQPILAQAHTQRLTGQPSTYETRLLSADGKLIQALITGVPRWRDGKVAGAIAVVTDLTERKQAEQALLKEQEFLKAVLENIPSIIVACDADGVLSFFDRAARQFYRTAIPADEWSQHYGLYLADGTTPMRKEDIPLFQAFEGKSVHNVEMVTVGKDGVQRAYLASGQAILGADGEKLGAVVAMHDITERKRFEEQLEHQAFHDALTSLPNRALFMDRLGHALVRARRDGNSVAVLFLDLDNFKVINDSLGHKVGDQLLIAVSQRLRASLRPEDTVARLGGDEFTVLVEDITGPSEAISVAERISEHLGAPIILGRQDELRGTDLERHELFVTSSIGIALHSSLYDHPDDLLRNADVAMYEAKRRGKACHVVFEQNMTSRFRDHLQLETDLRRALEREEFRLYYQPIVKLESGRITELEALIRWEHPQRGLVPPLEFISAAEQTGLIMPMGRWVLQQACQQLQQWQRKYPPAPGEPPLKVSVNLSARQFQHRKLIEEIDEVLSECGLDPRHLKLEITESVGIEDVGFTSAMLWKLKEQGLHLALDDFGTGYSALSYLKRYPFDTLKLDRTFVDGLGQDRENTAIVHAAIAFAKALSLSVTAEGIETAEQLAELRRLGCDQGQGYYFARPVPGVAVSAMLANPPWAAKDIKVPYPEYPRFRIFSN
jgi:diguanylate cyclase (GGDEF)-like protein/PAS domain S-box-containing protein